MTTTRCQRAPTPCPSGLWARHGCQQIRCAVVLGEQRALLVEASGPHPPPQAETTPPQGQLVSLATCARQVGGCRIYDDAADAEPSETKIFVCDDEVLVHFVNGTPARRNPSVLLQEFL